jgi:MFS family permease
LERSVPRRLSVDVGLLRGARDFRLLFAATLASALGTWPAFVALVVDVYDRTGSAGWVSVLLVVEFVPFVVIGLVAGPLLDRLPRRGVMVAADAVRALLFLVLVFAGGSLHIVLIALLAGVASAFFRPAVYAGLPNLVPDEKLPQANGFLQAADNLTMAIGPVLGGVLVAAAGPHPAYLVNAASFVVSGALILAIRAGFEEGKAESKGHWRDLRSGLALLRSSAVLRAVVCTWSVVMLASAGISVAEVFLAEDVLGGGDFGYGLFVSASGLGLVSGSLLAGRAMRERSTRSVYATAIMLMAISFVGVAAAPTLWSAAALLVVGGVGNGLAIVCNGVLIQRGIPDRLRGRAFTVAMSLTYAALGVGMIAAAPVTNALGARTGFGISGGLCLLAAPLALLLSREQPAKEAVAAESADPAVSGGSS